MVSRWYKNAAGRNCSGDPAELRLPADAGNIILAATNSIAAGSADPLAPARAASYLILTSAQYQVER